jgi:PBP1b-binding outer membrane lipoprotein LpoB
MIFMDGILDKLITPEVVSVIITVLLLPILKGVSKFVIMYLSVKTDELSEKIKSKRLEHYSLLADDVIRVSIESVAQTYVDSLKASGSFDVEAQNEAFIRAKDKAIKLLNTETKNVLNELHGDFTLWVENRIESMIKYSK